MKKRSAKTRLSRKSRGGIVCYKIDFTHYRLEDLVSLANQAKPFYEWIEKQFQREMHLAEPFNMLIKNASFEQIENGIRRCYEAENANALPKLYDGGGVPYEHTSACYFMFAWMARDAATQRLRPLIARAKKASGVSTKEVELEILARLLHYYKDKLQFFEWPVIREITLQRLEGSRRAKKGSAFENYLRVSLAQAFSYYFQTHGNYGKYSNFNIWPRPIKISNRTYDAAVDLIRQDGTKRMLIIPSKTRETEGGGHAHLFTRDIEQANLDILEAYPDAIIAFMIVAQNWSQEEIDILNKKYSHVFYFDVNPNEFNGFADRQAEMNLFVEGVLNQ